LTFGHTVTTPGASATITAPICGVAPKLTVTKVVVGGTKGILDFPLFMDGLA